MKFRFLIIILMFFVAHAAYASKGRSGSYTLKFVMLDRKTDLPVQYAVFVINNDTLKSDSTGTFLYVFKWQTICPSLIQGPLRRMKIRKINRQWNKYIMLNYSGHASKKIRSCWRRYGLRDKRNADSAPVEVYVKW